MQGVQQPIQTSTTTTPIESLLVPLAVDSIGWRVDRHHRWFVKAECLIKVLKNGPQIDESQIEGIEREIGETTNRRTLTHSDWRGQSFGNVAEVEKNSELEAAAGGDRMELQIPR